MSDSFFGFDTSVSNINDDDGGGGDGSEDEYDALNDETFGHEQDELDWEVQHELVAEQLESSRRHNTTYDDTQSQLEASLSQLVLDETDAPCHVFNSQVWRHDPPIPLPPAPVPQALKNVHTVEELERQMRQNQQPGLQHQMNQNFFQPRFPPVILQRPPGLQAPVSLPFAPNQPLNQHNMPMNRPAQHPHSTGSHHMTNQMMGNSLTPNVNQFMQNNQFQGNQNQMLMSQGNMNQMVPNGGQFGPNMNQFQHMMNQPRMMAPPPGLNMAPRQNFSPNLGFNPNFRGPTKPVEQPPAMNQQHQNMMMNQMMQPNIQQMKNQTAQPNQQQKNPPNHMNQPNHLNQTYNMNQPNNLNQTNNLNQSNQPKSQKQRVIYNSNQKNLTSENLVQYIQNTHPILQLQQSGLHNAQHHPMLHQRQYNNQQPTTLYGHQSGSEAYTNNNRHLTNGDAEAPPGRDVDTYAGLMTQREKQWLVNIQMLQLNTGTPYIHDFYYTVFLERQSRKEKEGVKEAHKANRQNHPFYSGGVKQESHRERHNSARHNSGSEEAPRVYVPTQFENSLGKLQCGSVTAPRKIIDVEVVQSEAGSARPSRAPSVASTTNPAEVPREMRRTKQLLLDIEALYLIMLRLEELNDPLAISNALILKEREERQKQLEQAVREAIGDDPDDTNLFLRNIESVQRRPKTESPKHDVLDKRQVVNLTPLAQNPSYTAKNLLDENKDDLMNKMFASLLHEDRLQQLLLVRKGRNLLWRFVSRVPASHPRLRALWQRVLRALPAAARRDDPALHKLAPHYRNYLQNTNGWAAVQESCGHLAEAFDPARTHYALASPLTLSIVCALIEKSSTLVNTPEATANERQWMKFLKTFARALKNTSLTVAKPLKPITEGKLTYHIKQLESRATIEILQRGKTTAEFADLSKNEFSELLIRHLC